MSATSHPTGFNSCVRCPGRESLQPSGERVKLRQLTQVPMANVFINPKIGLFHVCAYKLEGIGSGQEGKVYIAGFDNPKSVVLVHLG